ncbi:MAG: thiamine phosphate synthase [Candidatus Latescibacterota bacterium]
MAACAWNGSSFPKLYFLTDRALSRKGNPEDVRAALEGGVRIVQYREKTLSIRDRIQEALRIKALCHEVGATFVVNDRVDLSLAVGADGVHLGQEDMPLSVARRLMGEGAIIGITVHNVPEALQAVEGGADYLGASPIFTTRTKADAGAPMGLAGLREIRAQVRLPIVGIGGINRANARQVLEAGADSLCALSAILSQEDVGACVREWISYLQI